jgi:hypothetical protein
VFLYLLLRQSPIVDNVWLVHGDGVEQPAPNLLMDDLRGSLRPISAAIDNTDLFIEMNAPLALEHVERLHRRDTRLVSYRFGNDYVMALEQCTFNVHPNWWLNRLRIPFDEVWTNAQHEHTSRSFLEAALRAPVHILPHPWSPRFIEAGRLRDSDQGREWGYRNRGPAKHVGVFEPNVNVVKSLLIPLLAANEFHRQLPEHIDHLYLCNADTLADNVAFNRLAHGLEIVRARKATATNRHPFYRFVAEHVDIVLTHQWENGLNYLYYEALHGGYPLVHNSPFLRDVGYYYEGFDVRDAAAALTRAALTHDERPDTYAAEVRDFLERVRVDSPANIAAYTERIRYLFEVQPKRTWP